MPIIDAYGWTTPPDWFYQPMRWANLTLAQDDPGKYDPDFWLDLVKRAHCDAASWNSGGIIAFYPTQIPYHRRNETMGDTDPLGYLVEGCRKLGIIATARVDHHATYEDAARAHPEWIARDSEGNMRRHWAKPDLFVTCAFSPYNYEFMTSVMKEIVSLYMVDGFNHNRWGGSGMCWCENCRHGFEAFSGRDLPRVEDPRDPNWQRYQVWRQERIFELWDLWDSEIRKINPNAGILPGMGSEMARVDLAQLRRRAHTLYHDHQGRSGLNPPWSAGKGGKELRAILGRRPAGLTFSVGLEGYPYRWKDSVQTEAEMRIWALDGVANGMHLKFCKFSGYLHDTRWPARVEELYSYLHSIEPYLRNEAPLARVALVFSQQTRRFYGDRTGNRDAEMGMYHALIEARIPFEMVHEGLLEPQEIDKFKLLILPNIAALSEKQCEQLRSYVERGGSLVATLETSLCDEWGERRKDFGLSDLFGVSADGPVQGPMKNSYLRLEQATGHPLLAGLTDAERIINGVYRVPVRARERFADPPVTFIPPYPDLPMEEVYPREDHTGIPEIYLRAVGNGRVAYIPWDIDRVFWEVQAPDHGRLLGNIVRWASGEEPPVIVEGPGMVEVTLWRQQESVTVHLVNLSNPMLMKGPFREFIPIGEQTVRVRLPEGSRAKTVRLLAAGQTPSYEEREGWLHLSVPSIVDHEVVAIDL